MAEIKIYGTLVNMTTDQKLALTRQLYDETLGKFQDIINKETEDNINTINESLSSITSDLDTIIVDNLTSDDTTKALSAKQGKVLKSLIDAIKSFSIIVLQEEEDLPETGNLNTLYFKKKEGSDKDIYNEYIYVENAWELIGNTEIDLSNYYTKDQVYSKTEVDEKIPDIETVASGSGNVITSITVDSENKHKINISKDIDVYTKSEIDSKLSDSGLGDVIAAAEFTTENRVIVANGAGKVVKDSGILIENLALKSYVDEKEIAWDKVTGKPGTYTPSAHNHTVADISDFPEIPDPVQVDSELSTTSENPVQNKVIDAALKGKLDSTVLENYYNKEEVDSKISAAGGGNVYSDNDFSEANRIIVSTTGKTIKESEVLVNNIALKEDINGKYFPITGGDLQGNIYPANGGGSPTGNLGNSTKSWFSAYVSNIHSNNISKINTASSRIGFNTSPYDAIYVAELHLGDKGSNVNKTDEINAIVLTGNGTKFLSDDGTYKEINGQDIPIALPNPYPLTITGGALGSYDGSRAVSIAIPESELRQSNSAEAITTLSGGQLVRYTGTSELPSSITLTNFSDKSSSAIFIVPANISATFTSSSGTIKKSEDPTGTSDQIKAYAIQYIIGNLYLINSNIYK